MNPYKQSTVNLNPNSYIFIQENPFENVLWKMSAIWSLHQRVNSVYLIPDEQAKG